MSNVNDISDTLAAKSDQLNADDLISGPITVRVLRVSRGATADQPIEVAIEGHRPYRPCKTMRRLLVAVWGKNGEEWVGRSLTLYRDPKVEWGGVAVGGIRVSHVSGIDRTVEIALAEKRGKRAPYRVQPLRAEQGPVLAAVLDGAGLTMADADAWAVKNGKPPVSGLNAEAQAKLAAWLSNTRGAFDAIRAASTTTANDDSPEVTP